MRSDATHVTPCSVCFVVGLLPHSMSFLFFRLSVTQSHAQSLFRTVTFSHKHTFTRSQSVIIFAIHFSRQTSTCLSINNVIHSLVHTILFFLLSPRPFLSPSRPTRTCAFLTCVCIRASSSGFTAFYSIPTFIYSLIAALLKIPRLVSYSGKLSDACRESLFIDFRLHL